MSIARMVRTKLSAVVTTTAMVAAGLGVSVLAAPSAAAADGVPVVAQPTSTQVTADVLPTTQINGVAWDQAVVGNTVYVAGQFTTARPAGAAAGTNTTIRNNMLSYDLTTGVLNTTFNPNLNTQAKAVVASPDGTRIYVVGQFTTANGVSKSRIAAYSTSTGALITTFATPSINATVNAVAATNTTVYVGGSFTTVGGQPRSRLASFNASNGALTGWAPTTDATVSSMLVSPDGAIIVGGYFTQVNGSGSYGLAKLTPSTADLLPWNPTYAGNGKAVANGGPNSSIISLTTDGTSIYGTGYHFGSGGNLEGTFSADPATGALNWVTNCHGDTYDAAVMGGAVYTVSHAHYCSPVGGFPQSDPWQVNMRHALAFTTNATGVNGPEEWGYYDWSGVASPSMINWYPNVATGTFTGQTQAAWTVTGSPDGKYLVMGGEFPTVNGGAQQGLVRFAVSSVAANKVGPNDKGSKLNPTIIGLPSGSARVSWLADWDMDDHTLSYNITRNGVSVYQTTNSNSFWDRPTLGFIDTSMVAGQTYKYRVMVTDSDNNVVQSDIINYTATAGAGSNTYATKVVADGASTYWPMNETSGTVLYDNAGFNDGDTGTGVTRGVSGAISGDAATTFDGSTTASTRTAVSGPNTFTAQAWIKTSTTSGGKIIGFGNAQTGTSGSYDRHVYMDNSGRIWFGMYPNGVATVNSSASYNDGLWHQISASLGADGMKLYIDGKLVAQRGDVTWGQAFSGYWRVGGDNIGGWPAQPSSNTFAGTIDEVAIYPTVLSRQTIDAQWVASGRPSTIQTAPADAYGAAVFADNPLLFWRLGETSGLTAADSGQNGDQTGDYQNGVSLGAAGGIKGTSDKAATFDGNDDFVSSKNTINNPKNYSEEAWFKTTSAQGKIIGLGNSNVGTSGGYDRHVYLNPDGTLVFGVWTGFTNTITTSQPVNNGVWHHVVATQSSSEGMKLYLDGQLVGTNGQTGAQDYTGYWRVGGDNNWGTAPFFNGTIDDAAVYSYVLTPAQVTNHFNLGNTVAPSNQAPVAQFSSTSSLLNATFTDGSSDPDGSIAAWSWNFGDGQTGTTQNPVHSYAAAGTYSVALTVTDNSGGTATVSHDVTVAAAPVNQSPVASFTPTVTQLSVTFDASASSDPDGTVTGYAWNFGDGQTSTQASPTHVYGAAGTYNVTLTVTDDKGATGSTTQQVQVTAPAPNNPPAAAFTFTANGLTANVESTSTDSDGTLIEYTWDFGDGASATTASASHTYLAGGTYSVKLTVKDDDGATTSVSHDVTVTAPPAQNQPPVAAFTATSTGLTASFNGSASADPDGTISAYSWTFGDSQTDMSGATTSHTYAAAGTYAVTLLVTDDKGATNSITKQVTVSAPAATPLVNDTFSRAVTNAFGTADVGGAWTITGGASNFSVSNGTGKVKLASAGAGPTASLAAPASANVIESVDVTLDKAPTGAGVYLSLAARKVGTSEYRTTAKLLATGQVQLSLVKIVNGTSTTLRTVTVAGLTYTAGDTVTVKLQVTGTATVSLNAKVFKTGTTEPAWQASATDSSGTIDTAGGLALYPYLSGSSTNAPVTVSLDNVTVYGVTP